MSSQLLCWNLSLFLCFPWTVVSVYQPFPSHQLTAQLQPWLGQWQEVGFSYSKQVGREPGLWGAEHPQVSGGNRILKFAGVEACKMWKTVLQRAHSPQLCGNLKVTYQKHSLWLFSVSCFGFSPFLGIFPLIWLISFPFNLILSFHFFPPVYVNSWRLSCWVRFLPTLDSFTHWPSACCDFGWDNTIHAVSFTAGAEKKLFHYRSTEQW